MKIAITGINGRLGGALARHHRAMENEVVALDRLACDLGKTDTLATTLAQFEFDALINPAAMTSLEICEDDPELSDRVNAIAPGILANVCASRRVPFIHISTDYVFDGKEPGTRSEIDPTEPISVYGSTKLNGERATLSAYPQAWVARVSWLFGPERPGFVEMIRDRLAQGESLAAIDDKFSCPTYVDDAAVAFDHLLSLTNGPGGVVHVCNPGPTSWHGIASEIVARSTRPQSPIASQKLDEMTGFRAPRPIHTAMGVARLETLTGYAMRPWKEALAAYFSRDSE
jgi:dTDP-4-dehydrorhamnose reductase